MAGLKNSSKSSWCVGPRHTHEWPLLTAISLRAIASWGQRKDKWSGSSDGSLGTKPARIGSSNSARPLVALARVAPFEADLWQAQNTYYEVMTTVASLKPSHLSAQWFQEFRRLGDCLGIAVSEPLSVDTTSSAGEARS